jgi:hypothetical protein
MTRAQSLKRRWNMPSVGDKSPVVLFPHKRKKDKKKKNPKLLLIGIYSPHSPTLIALLLIWWRPQSCQPRLPPLHSPS